MSKERRSAPEIKRLVHSEVRDSTRGKRFDTDELTLLRMKNALFAWGPTECQDPDHKDVTIRIYPFLKKEEKVNLGGISVTIRKEQENYDSYMGALDDSGMVAFRMVKNGVYYVEI